MRQRRTILLLSSLLSICIAGCQSPHADRYATLARKIEKLSQGMEAQEVYDRLGQPDLWGNWDGAWGFNTSWMTTGGYGPLPVGEDEMHYRILAPGNTAPHVLDWLYCLSAEGVFGKVSILRFRDYKLQEIHAPHLDEIYDP